jgi:Sulfotransferase family
VVGYCNRSFLDEVRMPIERLLGISRPGKGKSHFVFKFNNKKIAYCYIRKNACSAFKRLLIDASEHRTMYDQKTNPISFLEKFHKENSIFLLNSCDCRIFVYRCPIRRATSLFINKFVMQNEAEDIIKSVTEVTGLPPERLSFDDFVNLYLCAGFDERNLDPHSWKQVNHLHEINYTHAIHLPDLKKEMEEVIGTEGAEKYFAKPVNAAEGIAEAVKSDMTKLPAGILHHNFLKRRVRPSHEQLLNGELQKKIEYTYEADVALFQFLSKKYKSVIN